MSEIKYININDDRFWQILFDEACVEGKQEERIQRELAKISVNEKEIIRKPMQDIVERLEEEKGIAFLTLANTGNKIKDIVYDEVMAYLNTAIEICKEVGEIDG